MMIGQMANIIKKQ